MKKILVIGSNCFSGSDFIDLLISKGTFQVVGISRSKEKSDLFLPYKKQKSSLFTFYQVDLNKSFHEFEKIVDQFQPDIVVNFSAQSEVASSWKFPHHYIQTNAFTLSKMILFLKNKKYLKKYIHISSPEVYGDFSCIATEKTPLNPSTPYAASKAAADLLLMAYFKHYNFPAVFIRSTNVFGPHQQLYKIIPKTIISILLNKKIKLHGGGKAIKSFIHIRDVSEGILLALKKAQLGEIYHFSPMEGGTKIQDLVQIICQKMDVTPSDVIINIEERLGQDRAYIISSEKAKKELAWNPNISLNQGVDLTIQWVRENIQRIKDQPLNYIHEE